MINRRMAGLILAAAMASSSLLGGCATRSDYDALYDTNQSLRDRNAQLQRELEDLRESNRLMSDQAGRADGTVSDLRNTINELRRQVRDRDQALSEFEGRFAQIEVAPLDAETDRALADLASRYPDLIEYDPDRGMIRFASDLTFASGSAEVRDRARNTLEALADVLNSSAASPYEVRIVGHTDNVPIGNPATRERHPTNLHLSAHRAISVRSVLREMGVQSGRMMVAGWGEHRPAVPNNPSGGTEENRRVEIYLTRPTGSFEGVGGEGEARGRRGAEVDRQRPPARPDDPTK